MTVVKVKYLIDRYSSGAILDSDTFFLLYDLDDRGVKTVNIPQSQLDAAENLYQERKNRDKMLYECCERNNKGIDYEKNSDTRRAIKIYEENIVDGCYPARHSFDRLMILYRRMEDYDNEIRVIRRAISVFHEDAKYIDKLNIRLKKAEILKINI